MAGFLLVIASVILFILDALLIQMGTPTAELIWKLMLVGLACGVLGLALGPAIPVIVKRAD